MNLIKFLLVSVLFLSSKWAFADNWGCTVVLCIANPKGPTALPECVAPIKKLWRELAKGNPFPTCILSNGSASSNASERSSVASDEYNCPVQYLNRKNTYNAARECAYGGYVSLFQNDVEIARVWWNAAGEHVTQNLTADAPVTDGSKKFNFDYETWINNDRR